MLHLQHVREEHLAAQAELKQYLIDNPDPEEAGALVLARGNGHFRHQTVEERAANRTRHQNDVAGLVRARDFWAVAVAAEEKRLLGPSGKA